MADTRPTSISFHGAVRLCFLLLLAPAKFIAEQQKDADIRENYPRASEKEHPAYIIRRAFLYSFVLVVVFGGIGGGTGYILGLWVGCLTPQCIAWLQMIGTSLLLWGTLFVRGWEIQTYSGVTYAERVNQWLYRFLYCIGTAVLVCSLTLPQCSA